MNRSNAEESQSPTQAQVAYQMLEEMIVTLKLPPGSRISETSMSQQLGLGRTPVREAMQRLAHEGSLKILSRAGAIVSEVDVADQFKLIEVRRELERIVIGRAARLADARAIKRFEDLRQRFLLAARDNDETVFIGADREFNQLTIATANNKYAAAAMAPIQAQTRRFWFLNFHTFRDLAKVATAHAEIAAAIAMNDEAAARRAFDALIDYVEEYTMRTLKELV